MNNSSYFERLVSYFFIILLIIVGVTYLYYGVTVLKPTSVDYSFPISNSILSGRLLHLGSRESFQYIYFPGASYAILSLFTFFHIPPNLFGLLSWIILIYICILFARTFSLNKWSSWIFAGSLATTITVIRTINDQSVDKWLCVWFLLSVILLEKTKNSWWYFLALGGTLGMLIGTKYSGPLFFICLFAVYWRTFFDFLKQIKFIAVLPLFIITGLFWYIRNLILAGSPFFPAPFLMFKGYPHFTQQDWYLWKIPFSYPQNILPIFNAWLSEYMIWTFSGVIIIWFIAQVNKHKVAIDEKVKRLLLLAGSTSFVSLFLPITPAYKIELFHIVSDMRYVYIPMALCILLVFIIAQKYNKTELLYGVAVLNAISLFSFLPYLPKIYIGVMLGVILLYPKRKYL